MSKRDLSALELSILKGALEQGETVDSLSLKAGVDANDLQNVFTMQGLSLPTSSAARITPEEQAAYLGVLASDTSSTILPSMYGFSTQSMLDRLRESQLLIPLTPGEKGAYESAVAEGLNVGQAAKKFGVTEDYINTGLSAAGLSLTGKKPAKPTSPQIGMDNPESMFAQTPDYGTMNSIFGSIPQIPQLRMVKKNSDRRSDPNWKGTTDTILTSGQGLLTDPNLSVKTLLGT